MGQRDALHSARHRAAVRPVTSRWPTIWWLLWGSLFFSACAFTGAWIDQQSATAFARSSHPVTGQVVKSDCWVLCKGGPDVDVAFAKPGTGRVVADLDGVDRHYRVGDQIDVVYSDDPHASDLVAVPPAETYYRSGAFWLSLVGLAGLFMAFFAWAFPAHLRRADSRDAARAQPSGNA